MTLLQSHFYHETIQISNEIPIVSLSLPYRETISYDCPPNAPLSLLSLYAPSFQLLSLHVVSVDFSLPNRLHGKLLLFQLAPARSIIVAYQYSVGIKIQTPTLMVVGTPFPPLITPIWRDSNITPQREHNLKSQTLRPIP